MSTTITPPNGAVEVVHATVVDHVEEAERMMRNALTDRAHELRAMLTAESNRRMDLERLLAVAKNNERRLAKAIQALEGEDPVPPGRPKSTPASKSAGDWTISEERANELQALFVTWWRDENESGDPITKTEFGRILKDDYDEGVASETLSKVFEVMRERQVVRKAGATRGGGQLWKLMPGVLDAN